jgi:hypothetical protein
LAVGIIIIHIPHEKIVQADRKEQCKTMEDVALEKDGLKRQWGFPSWKRRFGRWTFQRASIKK